MHIIHCIFGITTAIAALTACGGETSDEPRACRDGSCDHQSTNTFCDIDGVYPGTEAPNECIAPPAADACNRAVACDDAAKPYCDDDSMGTCVECTENLHCTVEGESCNPISGQCTTEVVVQCDPDDGGDATCAANSDVGDYCSDAGACADCLVDDHCSANVAEAICGQDLLECRGCEVGGSDCETGLCGTNEEGVCIQPSEVIYVNGGTGVDGGACDEGNPCETIAGGIEKVEPGRNIILVAAGAYGERITIANTDVSLVADGDVVLSPSLNTAGESVFTISGNSKVTLDGFEGFPGSTSANQDITILNCIGGGPDVTVKNVNFHNSNSVGIQSSNCTLSIQDSEVSGNTGIGISATGGTLEVQDSEVSNNAGIGISATGGTLEVLRSKILSNVAGGIDINNSDYELVNNFIGKNGTTGSVVGGVRIGGTAGGTEVLDFNTIASNVKADAIGYALTCSGSNLIATNNILMLDPVIGGGLVTLCNTDFTLIDSDTGGDTGTHTNTVEAQASFVDNSNADFHLLEGSPGTDVADGTPPATDIDGDPRTAGSADMGADEFVAN